MILIGLNGRLHSGKDTAVQFIRLAADGRRVARAGFADRLKMSFVSALGFDPLDIDEAVELANKIKETGFIVTSWKDGDKAQHYPGGGTVYEPVQKARTIDGREAQQRYGTEAHRNVFGEDFWVDALLPRPPLNIGACFPGTDVLVVTDCRFANEAQRILDLGGQVWHIDAGSRLGPLPADAHPSEHPLPGRLLTCTVKNNTSLEQFEANVRSCWEINYGRITS